MRRRRGSRAPNPTAGALLAVVAILLLPGAASDPFHVLPVELPHAAAGSAGMGPAGGRDRAPTSSYASLRSDLEQGSGVVSTGPITNAWTNVSVPDLPPATAGASMAFDPARGATILFGGVGPADQATNDTWSYQSTLGDWTNLTPTLGPEPPARSGSGLAFDNSSGDLLLFGGSGPLAPGGDFGDCWLLPPVGGWEVCPPSAASPSARSNPALVSDPALGGVLLYGGQTAASNLNDTWLWSAAGGWVELHPKGTAPEALWGMEGTALPGDEGVLLYGGMATKIGGDSFYYGTFVLSPSLVWSYIATVPSSSTGMNPGAGLGALAFLSSSNEVVLFGGAYAYSIEGTTYASSQTWVLPWGSPYTWSQSPAQNVSGEFDVASTYDPTLGAMLVFGGVPSVLTSAPSTSVPVRTNFAQFDARTNWTGALNDSAPPALALASAAYDSANGDVLLFGGVDELDIVTTSVTAVNQTWVLAPDGTWTLERPLHSPSPRGAAVLEYLPPPWDEFVLFGGLSTSQSFNDTWTYQIGGDWENVTGRGVGPPARASAAAAAVPGEPEFLLFGGVQGCAPGIPGFTSSRFINDTWEYSPAGWTNITKGPQPPVRAGSFLAPTATPGVFLLAGGLGPSDLGCTTNVQSLKDTWSFDLANDTWSELPFPFSSGAPVFGCAAYDDQEQEDVYTMGIAGVFLLAPGYSNTVYRAGTSEDFSQATVEAETPPAARAMTACVFDPQRDGTLLIGGVGDTPLGLLTILGGAWLLRDVAWGLTTNVSQAFAGASVAVALQALTPWGTTALRNATVHLEDSTGTVQPSLVAVENGLGEVNATISSPAINDTLEACGLGVCVNSTLSVRAAPARLSISPVPATVTAGERFALVVQVLGGSGAPVLGFSGNVSLTAPGSALSLASVGLTNGDGSATPSFLRSGTDLALLASVDGLVAEDRPIDVLPSFLARLNVSGAPTSTYEGSAFTLTVTGEDGFGNPENGTVVRIEDSLHDVAEANVTLRNGSAALAAVLGPWTGLDALSAESGNVSTSVTIYVHPFPVTGQNGTKSPTSSPIPWESIAFVSALLAAALVLLVLFLWGERRSTKKKRTTTSPKAGEGEKEPPVAPTSLLAFLPAEEKEKERDQEEDET